MRLNKEERYQLKLIRLAKEISRSGSFIVNYSYNPSFNTIAHQFHASYFDADDFLVYRTGFETAEACYKWAVDECRRKGVIQ